MKIVIKDIDNGYLLHYPNPNTDGEITEAFVADDQMDPYDNGKAECNAIERMFWSILDQLRPYSKHSKYNVVIKVEKNKDYN